MNEVYPADPEFRDALSKRLEILVVGREKVEARQFPLQKWNVPDSTKEAVAKFGLPVMDPAWYNAFHVNPQEEVAPQAHYRDRSLYSIGVLHGLEVCLIPGRSMLIAIPDCALQHVFFVNSTMDRFLEVCWRYALIYPILENMEIDETFFSRLADFWQTCRRIDPAVEIDRSISLWQSVAEGEW